VLLHVIKEANDVVKDVIKEANDVVKGKANVTKEFA
jgi:L-lactate utilization protein LutB